MENDLLENELYVSGNWYILALIRHEMTEECVQDGVEQSDGNGLMENSEESVVSLLVCEGFSLSQSSYFASSGDFLR